MPSGIAVSASPKLWIRSASNATDPESDEDRRLRRRRSSPRTARLMATALTPVAGADDRAVDEPVRVAVSVAVLVS